MADASPIIDLDFRRHRQDLEGSWQCRLLAKSLRCDGGVVRPVDLTGAAILSIISHNYDDALPVLLRIAHAEFTGIGAPFFCSPARIAKTDHVLADLITRDGQKLKNQGVFRDEKEMETSFRKLADEARLDDKDRIELFEAVKRWVVCDYRLDPTMNSADPDAKRLRLN